MWPHSCSLELKTSSKSRPGLLQPTFRRSDSANVNVRMEVEDLSEGLRISKFVFDLCAGDRAVNAPKTAFIANKT